MVHPVGDRHAGGEPVVDEPPGARGEQLGQLAEQRGVLLRLGVERARELALDPPELRDENPLGIWRRVDGTPTTAVLPA